MKKILLALPFLLAGCQAERVAFQFQPSAPAGGVVPASGAGRGATGAAAGPTDSKEAIIATTTICYDTREALPGPTARPSAPSPNQRPATHPPRAAATPAPLAVPTETLAAPTSLTLTSPKLLTSRPLLQQLVRRHATAGPARAAENGLGGIALFFIAVVLAVLAGLGALLSLIPGISFLGGVGLTAAGLLVLFILYRLVSGGTKQQPAKK